MRQVAGNSVPSAQSTEACSYFARAILGWWRYKTDAHFTLLLRRLEISAREEYAKVVTHQLAYRQHYHIRPAQRAERCYCRRATCGERPSPSFPIVLHALLDYRTVVLWDCEYIAAGDRRALGRCTWTREHSTHCRRRYALVRKCI